MQTKEREIADELRELMNWVAVFADEYDLPSEVSEQLRSRIEEIAEKLVEIA